ncbi:hypothetical protein TWF730_004342 [Orbilia blumenaviensis]|uniref:Uncharacterized protein n=1 Tax=Orbilia blumenaviensis TaxID=1796055 RepID=A0AAV9U3R6_9PEZI
MRGLKFVAIVGPLFVGPACAAPRPPVPAQCDAASTYTEIIPKPGMKPTPVTKQFQAVYSCVPKAITYNSQGRTYETIYTTTSYRWVSTIVPCHSGVTTITRLDQPLTIAAYPTNRIETCHCAEVGPCYFGTTSVNVVRPTSFPYINSGWNYHVCEYSDYYRWDSGDYSTDYSGISSPEYSGIDSHPPQVTSVNVKPGYTYPGVGQHASYHSVASANNPVSTHESYQGSWRSKYRPDSTQNFESGYDAYELDAPGEISKMGKVPGGKSLRLKCHSCINGLCKTYPLRLVTKTQVRTRTVRIPYTINRHFYRSTTYCVSHLGITLTISEPTSISTIVTGTTTITSKVTVTDTTTISSTVVVTALTGTTVTSSATPISTGIIGDLFVLGAGQRTSCEGAQLFSINSDQQLAANGTTVVAFANPADLVSGSAPFRIGTGEITGSFGFTGGILNWLVSRSGGDVRPTFCSKPDGALTVIFLLDFAPSDCTVLSLVRIDRKYTLYRECIE